jgi:MFS family permease
MSSAVPEATAAARTGMPPGLIVLVLSLLLGIQPVTTDLYLPALPALTRELGAPVAQAQLTLTTLLLAFGTSQLLWGPCPTASAAGRCCCAGWARTRWRRSAACWRRRWTCWWSGARCRARPWARR